MLGTLYNVGTVLIGTVLGRMVGDRLRPETRSTVTSAIGCITLVMGVQNAMRTPQGLEKAPLSAQLGFFLAVLISILIGALLGEALDIEGRLHSLGQWAESRLGQAGGDFGKGFVAASLLFCVGPLTILGSFQDGIQGDYSLLAMKSVLDGFSAMAFAAAFGWGVLLSIGTIVVVQGSLTLSAVWVKPLLNDSMVMAMTAAGGILLVALAFRILDVKPIRVANLVPALLLAPLFIALANAARPGLFP